MQTKDNLDTLAQKADALEAMRRRGDANYQKAYELFVAERDAWLKELTSDALTAYLINVKKTT